MERLIASRCHLAQCHLDWAPQRQESGQRRPAFWRESRRGVQQPVAHFRHVAERLLDLATLFHFTHPIP
jgi:hypothetical protein